MADQLQAAQMIVPIVSAQNRYSLACCEDDTVVNMCAPEGVAFFRGFRSTRAPTTDPIPGTSSIQLLRPDLAAGAVFLDGETILKIDNFSATQQIRTSACA